MKSIDVFLLVNLPNNSVCPANLWPALCHAIFEIGAVDRALAFPSKRIFVACESHLKLAAPECSQTVTGTIFFSKGKRQQMVIEIVSPWPSFGKYHR